MKPPPSSLSPRAAKPSRPGGARRRPLRIQLICETNLEYFRKVILGIRQYSFSRQSVELCDGWFSYDEGEDLAEKVRLGHVDGIIAQVNNAGLERRLLACGVPVVNVSNVLPAQRLPLVTQDDAAVGEMAARHLAGCGCAAFGFWGHKNARYSAQRRDAMRRSVLHSSPRAEFFLRESDMPEAVGPERLVAQMGRWLRSLPKPAGIFTVLDTFGMSLLRAAASVRLRVPEDIALLSAGDDEFWVEYEPIPLSSIRLPAWDIGWRAAELAEEMIVAKKRVPQTVCLPVSEISVRQSSDVLFVQDAAIQRAMAFLRAHGHENIGVVDMVRASGVCRSALQTRFRAVLGCSVLEKIHRARLGHVQALLRSTDFKLTEIAERCHFSDSPRLNVFFKKCTGLTPLEYRRHFRR